MGKRTTKIMRARRKRYIILLGMLIPIMPFASGAFEKSLKITLSKEVLTPLNLTFG